MNKTLVDYKDEIIALWRSGEFTSHRALSRSVIKKYGSFGREHDNVRRSIAKWCKRDDIEQNKVEQFIPKILILDIETSPILANVWGLWKQNVPISMIEREWFMLCWSAKWLYAKDVLSGSLTKEEVLNQDDKRISQDLWKLLDEAELIIAHNGNRFDIPKINTRFLLNGLNRPSPYRTIDTLLVARKQFGFSSNKLDALAGYLGLEHKLSTDFSLWDRCVKGDEEAMKYMALYCDQDVRLLEEVYLELRHWIPNHPNIGLYFDEEKHICPNCGSTDIKDEKPYYTSVSRFPTYRCNSCGAIARGKKADNSNKYLLRSV